MRKFVLPLAIAVAALGATSSAARAYTADSCDGTGNVFNICIQWTLTETDPQQNIWQLVTNFYSSTLGGGKLLTTGLTSSLTDAQLGIDANSIVVAQPDTWSVKCDLNNFNILSVCAKPDNAGQNAGLGAGSGLVIIYFEATNLASNVNTLDYAAHVGGWGQQSCSIKLDTTPGETPAGTTTVTVAPENCGTPPSTVPEPVSLALLGTGLVGLGFIRRRRKAA